MRNQVSAFIVFLLVLTNFAAAQNMQIGLGGSLHIEPTYLDFDDHNDSYYNLMAPLVRIPISITSSFLVEPEFGIGQARYRSEATDSDYRYTTTFSIYTLNLYLKYAYLVKSTRLYPGIRFGIKYGDQVSKFSGGDSGVETYVDSDHSIVLGILYGGEVFLGNHFSLGGEAQLNYAFSGSEEDSRKIKKSFISTGANFIFRWYFK